ncbi:hypothetical protein DS079_13960 [Brachybacterium paraconglomeratum]|uniref:Uncharacterized protein n=2 Tax=Brachybacterium TaxID=43668 RepID=A0A3R8RPG9_9MICO|nr:hypothetical protein DS079_13960 [Brachybacterium paraconglomeratum]
MEVQQHRGGGVRLMVAATVQVQAVLAPARAVGEARDALDLPRAQRQRRQPGPAEGARPLRAAHDPEDHGAAAGDPPLDQHEAEEHEQPEGDPGRSGERPERGTVVGGQQRGGEVQREQEQHQHRQLVQGDAEVVHGPGQQ